MIRSVVHLVLHAVVPAAAARIGWPARWWRAWLVMLGTMAVDLDHLLASPVYDPDRCSIGFHPLHQYPAIAVYAMLALWPKTRLVGIGLLLHMMLDGVDCLWMQFDG